MKLQRIPVIVTTKEAWDIAMAEKAPIIYVANELYWPETETIDRHMAVQNYEKANKQGYRGIFFVRSGGENGFDERIHEIYDPFGIL